MESHGQQAVFSCRSKHSRRNPPSSLCGAAGLGERGHAGPGWKASACESTIWRVTITFSRSWPVGISRSGHTLRPEDFLEARTKRLRQRCGTGGVPSAFVAFDGPDLFGSAALVQHDLPDRTNLEPWLAGVYVTPLSATARNCRGTRLGGRSGTRIAGVAQVWEPCRIR